MTLKGIECSKKITGVFRNHIAIEGMSNRILLTPCGISFEDEKYASQHFSVNTKPVYDSCMFKFLDYSTILETITMEFKIQSVLP